MNDEQTRELVEKLEAAAAEAKHMAFHADTTRDEDAWDLFAAAWSKVAKHFAEGGEERSCEVLPGCELRQFRVADEWPVCAPDTEGEGWKTYCAGGEIVISADTAAECARITQEWHDDGHCPQRHDCTIEDCPKHGEQPKPPPAPVAAPVICERCGTMLYADASAPLDDGPRAKVYRCDWCAEAVTEPAPEKAWERCVEWYETTENVGSCRARDVGYCVIQEAGGREGSCPKARELGLLDEGDESRQTIDADLAERARQGDPDARAEMRAQKPTPDEGECDLADQIDSFTTGHCVPPDESECPHFDGHRRCEYMSAAYGEHVRGCLTSAICEREKRLKCPLRALAREKAEADARADRAHESALEAGRQRQKAWDAEGVAKQRAETAEAALAEYEGPGARWYSAETVDALTAERDEVAERLTKCRIQWKQKAKEAHRKARKAGKTVEGLQDKLRSRRIEVHEWMDKHNREMMRADLTEARIANAERAVERLGVRLDEKEAQLAEALATVAAWGEWRTKVEEENPQVLFSPGACEQCRIFGRLLMQIPMKPKGEATGPLARPGAEEEPHE